MNDNTSLTKIESAPALVRQPTVAEMLQGAISAGITSDSAKGIETLAGLYERMQDREAEKAFAVAFVELQKAIPRIKATKTIPDRNGGVRSSFAPLEEIDKQARPICIEHGFSYYFSEGEAQQGKVTKIFTLQHVGGHKRSNPYTVRVGSGPPGCSESQSDGSAHSYAKRGAMVDGLGIIVAGIDTDCDPRMEGGPITKAQADELFQLVKATGSNEQGFLKFAHVTRYEDIPEGKFESLKAALVRKMPKATP